MQENKRQADKRVQTWVSATQATRLLLIPRRGWELKQVRLIPGRSMENDGGADPPRSSG